MGNKRKPLRIKKNEYIDLKFMAMFNYRVLFFLLSLLSICVSGQSTRFFISAHQDDWQLFMNPNVYESIKNKEDKTVIIHTTAGEAGMGMGNDAYYLAREKGSLAAIRFLSNTHTTGAGLGDEMERNYVDLNGHPVLRYQYRNCVVYLFRLPDGNGNGTGYELHDFKTLAKLFQGDSENIPTIDKSTTYTNRKDVEKTFKALLLREQIGENTELHLADTNQEVNPGDHSDHQTSSLFFQKVAQEIGGIKLYLYANYATGNLPKNTTEEGFLVSAATWGVTTAHIADHRHYSTWDKTHNSWIGRQYYRTIQIPEK